jgi:hypothetical protein
LDKVTIFGAGVWHKGAGSPIRHLLCRPTQFWSEIGQIPLLTLPKRYAILSKDFTTLLRIIYTGEDYAGPKQTLATSHGIHRAII